MKRIKIGLTAFAIMAGVVSVFATRTSKFSGTTYWIDFQGHRFNQAAKPAECNGTLVLCATAFDVNDNPTGTIAKKPS